MNYPGQKIFYREDAKLMAGKKGRQEHQNN